MKPPLKTLSLLGLGILSLFIVAGSAGSASANHRTREIALQVGQQTIIPTYNEDYRITCLESRTVVAKYFGCAGGYSNNTPLQVTTILSDGTSSTVKLGVMSSSECEEQAKKLNGLN